LKYDVLSNIYLEYIYVDFIEFQKNIK